MNRNCWRHLTPVTCLILSLVSFGSKALAFETPSGQNGFDKIVAPFLKSHCLRCHGSEEPQAELSFSEIRSKPGLHDTETWQKITRQLMLGKMPPSGEVRPTGSVRSQVVNWISLELRRSGIPVEVELDLLQPSFGNYVDHAELFNGKHKGPAYSPSRLWRISPFISGSKYGNRQQLGRHLNTASQPFSVADESNIKDYASMWRIDGPTLELLLLNADQLVSNQIGPPPAELVAMDEAHRKRIENDPNLDEKKRKAVLRKKPSNEFLRWTDKETHVLAHSPEPLTGTQTESIIRRQFLLALKREPSEEELSRYSKMMTECVAEAGNLEGIRAVLTAILLMPETIYRFELGMGKAVDDGRRRLSAVETAFAVNYALRDVGPDKELLADTESGRILNREIIAGHVERMIDEELRGNYRRTQAPRLLRFFQEFFGYTTAPEVFKDGSRHSGHTPKPVTLVADTDMLIRRILTEDQDVLRELLTTNKVFAVYDRTRAFRRSTPSYNIPEKELLKLGDGDDRGRGKYPGFRWLREMKNQRAGILTQPSWLTAYSQNFDNDPVLRGKWIYERLLAGTIPDVPVTVDATVPADHDKSLRARLEKTREAYCWECHQKMNPLGMAFEMFDDVGRLRDKELLRDNKTLVPVDSRGEIIASGDPKLDGPVKNAIDLMHKLADSPRVRQ